MQEPTELSSHAVIAGFGVPGRAVAEWAGAQGMSFSVIELNPQIVERCAGTGVPIVMGDVRDEQALISAGIERAKIFAITVPDESAALEAVRIARRLNPAARIIARCTYISGGLEAVRRGADESVVAEEIAAHEFIRVLNGGHTSIHSNVILPSPGRKIP